MAYINAKDVRAIRNELKQKFGKTIKFSVTRQNHSAVCVKIMSSTEIDFTGASLPEYSFRSDDTPEQLKVARTIYEIIKNAPRRAGGREWFDKSDSMTDYFHIAYHYTLRVGKWNKPYEFLKPKQAA